MEILLLVINNYLIIKLAQMGSLNKKRYHCGKQYLQKKFFNYLDKILSWISIENADSYFIFRAEPLIYG